MGFSTDNYDNIYRGRKRMMLNNFLGGIAWSFGTLIGGIIIFTIIGLILKRVDLVPIIGAWLRDILQETFKNQPVVKGINIH